jgi:hypothetical protein
MIFPMCPHSISRMLMEYTAKSNLRLRLEPYCQHQRRVSYPKVTSRVLIYPLFPNLRILVFQRPKSQRSGIIELATSLSVAKTQVSNVLTSTSTLTRPSVTITRQGMSWLAQTTPLNFPRGFKTAQSHVVKSTGKSKILKRNTKRMRAPKYTLMNYFGAISNVSGVCTMGIKFSHSMASTTENTTRGKLTRMWSKGGGKAAQACLSLMHSCERWITQVSCPIEAGWSLHATWLKTWNKIGGGELIGSRNSWSIMMCSPTTVAGLALPVSGQGVYLFSTQLCSRQSLTLTVFILRNGVLSLLKCP